MICWHWQHPWVSGVTDTKPIRDLIAEAKADVFEEMQDLLEDQVSPVYSKSGLHFSVSTFPNILAISGNVGFVKEIFGKWNNTEKCQEMQEYGKIY